MCRTRARSAWVLARLERVSWIKKASAAQNISCKTKVPEYSPKPGCQTEECSCRLRKLRLGSACKIDYVSLDR